MLVNYTPRSPCRDSLGNSPFLGSPMHPSHLDNSPHRCTIALPYSYGTRRSLPTGEREMVQSFSMLDLSQRLQQLVTGWRGDERGEALSALHVQCGNAAGP